MAVQEVKLNKQVFGKISYSNIVDTEFRNMIDYLLKFLEKEILVHMKN